VRRNLTVYARAMLDDEWAAMRTGGRSKRAESVLTRTFEDVARFRPANAGEANAQSVSLQYLGALHDARHRRLDDNASGVSPFEWTILLIGAIVVIGICYLVGMTSLRAQLLMTAAVAAMIASVFVLVFELDYPFRGDLSIAPAGWQEFLDDNP
jgi:Flp pilus assembly protein TadB